MATQGASFDTIVVGARCAGAPVATLLARAGQKVLLLEASKLPSDQPLSTHFIQPLGVDWLDQLGVGAAIRSASPPSYVARMDLAGHVVDVSYLRGRAGHCLRRLPLDRLLQEAAVAAGAELRDQTEVTGLIKENDRVVGVETVSNGTKQSYRARVVVGADGRSSTVAKLAGAKEYFGYDNTRFGYWAYWPQNSAWRQDAELRAFDAYIGFGRDRSLRFVFQTDGDMVLLGVTPPLSELDAFAGNYEAAYLNALRASPVTAKLVEGNQREGKLIGVKKLRFFFREAAGPGFALVGDAALHKDPTPGLGITDAIRDARNLSRAILEGSDKALLRYWRQRDVDSVELFHFAKDMGDPKYVNPFNELLFEHVAKRPDLRARLAMSVDREISPYQVFSARTLLPWMLGATLKGKLSVIHAFLAAGKRGTAIQQLKSECIAQRDALLT